MDDNPPSADSPAPSPAKGRPVTSKKTSGRGITKKNLRKQVLPKRGEAGVRRGNRGKGRGRTKFYDDPRVQAAHERQKELRDAYSMVASVVKPALEALADMSIKGLQEDPTAHKAVPEYEIVMKNLDARLQHARRAADQEFNARTALTTRTYELDTICTEKKFQDSFNYITEEFLDAALNRVTILTELRREGCGLNLVDGSYNYQAELDDILAEQGPYVVFRDGIKIPYPSLLEENKKIVVKGNPRKTKPVAKRKADDLLDGQPDSKKPIAASGSLKADNGDDASTPRPRHIGGLLSAENVPDGEPESNAPSPTPLNEDHSPSSEPKASAAIKRKDMPDLPSGASDPDAWGVRTVNRRGPRANNRLVIPPPIEWDDDEIGFRDSTNDSSRKATRATRGKFLNKPNSRNFHLDRTIVTYDCLDYKDGDLDQAIVKKHKLHPKYGFFLPDSVNESEAPSERIDGTRPVIILTPNGSTLHASRTVRAMKMDHALETDARKERLAAMLGNYCEKEEIDPDEIVTDEMRERQRQALERLASSTDSGEDEDEGPADKGHAAQSVMAIEKLAREGTETLLHAAAYLDMDRPLPPSGGQRSSRPYDAVRDVFTNAEPEPAACMPPVEVDTYGLSFLADVAEHVSYKEEKPSEHHLLQLEPRAEHRPEYQSMMPLEYRHEPLEIPSMGDSMIDPRLRGPADQLPAAPPNAFLQTALNPTPSFTHIAPAPAPGSEAPIQPPQTRNPFTNQGGAKGSPVLPPLRPSRRDRAPETQQPPAPQVPTQPQPQEFGSPHGMLQTISGNFYPPAPTRPFHQSYSIHEPPLMPAPMHQGAPILGPGMIPNQYQPPPPPPSHITPYPLLSPPMPSQAQLAPMPAHIGPAPSVSPPNPPLAAPPPMGQNSRHRASIPSNGNGSGKYRKIAAAPIPHNRPWPANGGSELRLAHYDHKEAIKDYRANEPPPRTGPTTIRGWNVNNVSKGRNRGVKKEDSEEKDSPNITPFINKWNPSEKNMG
ncbi:hypothetical protein F5X96DRAFT_670111 [Biscogniauxia mediterranea]|nr:hypothetical protein F5X96DRAFT_670111 [Biscogniauxia mediterranea]